MGSMAIQNWKHYNKIIFKSVKSAVRPIFNKKLLKSEVCGTHEHCTDALLTIDLVNNCG